MWHTKDVGAILATLTDDYGYDVFQDRKRCVALCGDLLARYEQEQKIFQMLFHAGFGETLTGAPFQSEQQLRMGLLRIEKFLKQQAIDTDIAEEVINSVGIVIVGNSPEVKGYFVPNVTRTFQNIHFKLMLPSYQEFSDRIEISSSYLYTGKDNDIDSVLEKCVVTDRFGDSYDSPKPYSLYQNGRKKICVEIPFDKKKIYMRQASVELIFLCGNKKRIVVSYFLPDPKTWKFQHIEIYRMTEADSKRMKEVLNLLQKPAPVDVGLNSVQPPTSREGGFLSPCISEYSDALRQEILFLKQGRGKKHKVVDGERLHRDNKGVYTYTFNMETELHLSDDAPVTIETANGMHAVGSVLSCEDFQIILLLDRDLNDKVNVAYITVEPWKLLEALNEKMGSLSRSANRLAFKLIEDGPNLSTHDDISAVTKGQQMVAEKLKQEDIVAVWGPPGTGKTYTMANLAVDYLRNNKSVLIVSHSNVSVDGVIKQVLKTMDSSMTSYLRKGQILRFGYVRDVELSQHEYATSFNYALTQNPSLKRKLDSLSNQREEMKAKNQTRTAAYSDLEKKIRSTREVIRKEEHHYVEKAKIIGTTISKATVDSLFADKQFDLVMFDEVSMAYVPQVIVAASLAREKFMCVGDFRQLSPIVQSSGAAKILQGDIFSYLKIVDSVGHMFSHPWLVMINEQRRMHPGISAFVNRFVYKNLLKDHSSVQHSRDGIVGAEPLPGDSLNLIDLTGAYCAASKNNDNSRFNILSAIIAFSTAVNADMTGGMDSVGIITPYAAQTRLIRAMIRDYYKKGTEVVSCATVHQFQGSESDVLIFDAVESYPTHRVGFLMGKDMNSVTRLINVAITRAKGKLITIANGKFWERTFDGSTHIYYRLLKYISAGHNVVCNSLKKKNLKPYIESINPNRMIKIFLDEKEALILFERDMSRAAGRVVISIPDGELRETEKQVLSIIDDVNARGVDVLMKSNDYQELPDSWKRYCVGTENAVFPLIVIDDTVAWYGLPTSKMRFKVDKSTTQITVVQTMVRIDGKNTIEMIKALTNLESVEVGNSVGPLLKKIGSNGYPIKGNGHDTGNTSQIAPPGLAGFIEEKEFCSICKSHMVLSKGRRGTAYLKCSNKACKGQKYLEKEMMNWYISSKNIRCPKDGGNLTGIIGRYGPCIRCDRGHFLKPEDI